MKKFGEKLKGIQYSKRPGSYGVIVRDGLVGVIKPEEYETYFLTGGGIDAGEDERAALRREAREEIGYDVEVGAEIGAAEEYFHSANEQRYIVKECRFYRIALRGENNPTAKYELVWIGKDELAKMHHESYRWIAEQELAVFV